MRGIAGKTVIVSGGATSIGAAIVRAFRAAGANSVIADIAEEQGRALASELGATSIFAPADVTRDEDIAATVAAAIAAFGGIDFLVNGAVTYADKGLASSRAEWLASLNLNLVSGALFVRAVAPEMKKRGGGAIVNLSSVAGKFGQAGRALYPAAKAAIFQLTRSEAMELAVDRIRVNAVSPGWTWSSSIEKVTKGDRAKADRVAADYHPLGRVANPDEVANAVTYLCSDDASFITGIDLPVDGGYAMTGPDGGKPAMGRLSD
jgi:NAD(P)-dependent dehydrogenase (short-subunit alcohol dehydrogenase family)